MSDAESDSMATGEFSELDTLELSEEESRSTSSPEFDKGVKWALLKVAAWLESTRFVGENEVSQRAMDSTKAIIAEHARQAAANYHADKPERRPANSAR